MTPVSALAYSLEMPMIVQSDLLGEVAVEPQDLITFTGGLIGFEECHSFVLIPSERDGMYWLQSTEHSPLAFLLVDPFIHVPGFGVDVSPFDLAEVEATSEDDLAVLAIVTLPASRQEGCTVNLQGPIAFNLGKGRAKQIAISNSDYGVRYPIDLSAR